MKRSTIYCLLSYTFLAACQNAAPAKAKQPEIAFSDALSSDSLAKDSVFPEKMYEFSMTRDPKFCNPDSLVEGDCNSGFIYFTPKGNVIYNYLCLGTEDAFCIGKAKTTAKGMEITFDQCYSYKFSDDQSYSPTLTDMNSGKLEKIDPFTLKLKKIKCQDAYAYTSGPEYYIVTQSNEKEQKKFLLRDYVQIKALKDF